jgi:hypothetical protein
MILMSRLDSRNQLKTYNSRQQYIILNLQWNYIFMLLKIFIKQLLILKYNNW